MRTEGILADRVRSRPPRLGLHRDLVDQAALGVLLAEEQVGDDVEVVAERQVLEHGRDPERLGGGRSGHVDLTAVEGDGARVGLVDARDHLHQGRLAGTVVADERDHLSGPDVEVHVGQRLHGTESLVDTGQGEHALPGRRRGCGRHQEIPAALHADA
jgi:hypothetical protein